MYLIELELGIALVPIHMVLNGELAIVKLDAFLPKSSIELMNWPSLALQQVSDSISFWLVRWIALPDRKIVQVSPAQVSGLDTLKVSYSIQWTKSSSQVKINLGWLTYYLCEAKQSTVSTCTEASRPVGSQVHQGSPTLLLYSFCTVHCH